MLLLKTAAHVADEYGPSKDLSVAQRATLKHIGPCAHSPHHDDLRFRNPARCARHGMPASGAARASKPQNPSVRRSPARSRNGPGQYRRISGILSRNGACSGCLVRRGRDAFLRDTSQNGHSCGGDCHGIIIVVSSLGLDNGVQRVIPPSHRAVAYGGNFPKQRSGTAVTAWMHSYHSSLSKMLCLSSTGSFAVWRAAR